MSIESISKPMKAVLGALLLALVLDVNAARAQTVEYVHTDALGSVVAITDAAGSVTERNEYEPYGNDLTGVKDGPGYTGHVSDAATGLSYMQQRYYDPTIGRFLSVDPVTANSGTGANFNRYWYGNNNPYKFFDPDGRCTGSHIENKDGTCAGSGDFLSNGFGPTMAGAKTVVQQASYAAQAKYSKGNTVAAGPSTRKGGTNWPKAGAATLRALNSGRLMASGLAKFGVGAAASTTGAGAVPGVPTMAWGIWNLRSSANNYAIAGQLVDEASTVDSSGYSLMDGARVVFVGGLLPYGTLADDPGEPLYHQMILDKAKNFKEHAGEFMIEMGSISP